MQNLKTFFKNLGITILILAIFSLGIFIGSKYMTQEVTADSSDTVVNNTILPSTFSTIAKATLPAVVNIITEKTVVLSAPFMIPDPFRQFFAPMPEEKAKRTGMGSGFFISEDGYILTNNHVVSNADKITVTLQDGSKYSGKDVKVIGTDPRTDLALLKINKKKKFKYLKLGNSDSTNVGDWAIAEGNPFGLKGTLTVGVISGKGRENLNINRGPVYQDFLQTDASINPGNSGGPLLNIKGEVIGINSAILSTSGGNIGIGFAVPINMAKNIVEQLKKNGKIERGYMGIYPQNLTDDLAKAFNLDNTNGIIVRDIVKNSPAEKAGLKSGDIIIVYDGKDVKDANQFSMLVADTPIGKKVPVTIIRNGRKKTITVKIGKLNEKSVASLTNKSDSEKIFKHWGIKYVDAGSEIARNMGIRASKGAMITGVRQYSNAYYAGLKNGDLIVAVDNHPIDNSQILDTMLLKNINSNRPLAFKVKRQDMVIFTAFKAEK
ncbi:MAG TPA: Do family serine endopeptidase [Bacteroidetes bacterium]|nr:Do family serine endopeptidase [Bacteroidota bacterium]